MIYPDGLTQRARQISLVEILMADPDKAHVIHPGYESIGLACATVNLGIARFDNQQRVLLNSADKAQRFLNSAR